MLPQPELPPWMFVYVDGMILIGPDDNGIDSVVTLLCSEYGTKDLKQAKEVRNGSLFVRSPLESSVSQKAVCVQCNLLQFHLLAQYLSQFSNHSIHFGFKNRHSRPPFFLLKLFFHFSCQIVPGSVDFSIAQNRRVLP